MIANECDQSLFQKRMCLPQLNARNSFDSISPLSCVSGPLDPIIADALFVKPAHHWGHPGIRMHAIRDGSDWDLVRISIGPHLLPQLARHFAMLPTDAVS